MDIGRCFAQGLLLSKCEEEVHAILGQYFLPSAGQGAWEDQKIPASIVLGKNTYRKETVKNLRQIHPRPFVK